MRFRASALLAGSLLLAAATAHAVVPRPHAPLPADQLTALPAAAVAKPVRTHVELRFQSSPGIAWNVLQARLGGKWQIATDRATGVPSRIWGSGYPAPGANASPAAAEAYARMLLADHIALLAPGAAASDFVLVSNVVDGDLRDVGFAQYAGGRRVVGGQVSFRFEHDRLVVIASEALPGVTADVPAVRMTRAQIGERSKAKLRVAVGLASAPVTEPGDEVVLPLVADDAVLGYRVARPMTIDGGADGRYLAYADVATGEVLAVEQMNSYATGTLQYRGVDRYPARPRVDRPAPNAHVMVSGSPQTTAADGSVSLSASATVTTAVTGDFVDVVNQFTGGTIAAADLALSPGSSVTWDASSVEEDDAQVQAYLSVNIVKDFVRTHLDADLPKLNEAITANVNINQECNAFFDGKAINFFHSSTRCQNTALIQDVVFHEFGHNVHALEVIDGVGAFDGAMSEGAADFLAASITGDPGMGRGFFYNDEPLRSLDPLMEATWPEDVQEIHHTGTIYSGAMWDLRKALIAELGETDGIALTLKLYRGTLRRATNIPTALIEALVEDDDDGDLMNGTPHECTIRAAFGRHGLRTASGFIDAPGLVAEPATQTQVRINLTGLSENCPGDGINKVAFNWRPAAPATSPEASTVEATQTDPGVFIAQLPLPANGIVEYRARVNFLDGSALVLADNLADPYYQLYQGKTVPLYCTSFEDGDPLQHGWTTGASKDASPWALAQPSGGATDPTSAYSGTHFFAQSPGKDYDPDHTTWVQMPTVDVGHWSDVHLQYRRWLAVEDSHYDKARVLLNGKEMWVNATQNLGDSSSLHHIDREWRFHDVPLSGAVPGTKLDVRWELASDAGLQLGGWNLDDVCIVANVNSVCGDGVKTSTEACDDGAANADTADHCRTYCQAPSCGDGIVDSGEECDRGLDGDGTCTPACEKLEIPTLGGCCSGSSGGAGAGVLGALVGGLLFASGRRRRRARR